MPAALCWWAKKIIIIILVAYSNSSIAVAGPVTWNILAETIQSSDTMQNVKNQLKAHFF